MNMTRSTYILLLLLSLLLGTKALAQQAALHHSLEVTLDPAASSIAVTDTLTLPPVDGSPRTYEFRLNQALSLAGGPSLLRGKVEFIRFTREGELDRRQFAYNPNAPSDAPANPILMAGDIIRVQDSGLSASIGLLNELTGPLVGVYSAYSLFR